MKQYLTFDQTAKLIELGFEKPSSIASVEPIYGMGGISVAKAYTIGELLSFLPENIAKENEMPSTLNISLLNGEWCVQYADFLGTDFEFCNTELVDVLYDMIVKLKGKGVI
ncbi:MAG: hypothetical protein J6B41_07080 [Alistipes sp.]|nr:hypothetical protein [Alistipes sp.]